MPKGITQNDVWQACDALLLAGERPTIERVRQKIGRGSPNTVSPFLDTWFKHLGARIKDPGAFAAPSALPDPVLQAAKHFWEIAQAEARRDFDERLREGLAAAVANVEAEKERAAVADAAAFEASARATRLQVDLQQRSAALDQERAARLAAEADLAHTRRLVDDLRGRLDRALAETVNVRDSAQRSLAEAIERFTAAERRAALEIDTERTARGKSERRAESLERRLEGAQAEVATLQLRQTEVQATLRSRLAHWQEGQSAAMKKEAALQQRVEELQAALALAEQAAHAAQAQAQMAERLVTSFKSAPARKALARRVTSLSK